MSDTPNLLVEYDTAERLYEGAEACREHLDCPVEAYSPVPVDGLAEVLGHRTASWLAPLVLLGGVIAAAGGWFMQWYSSVVDYPLNIGGRPLNSWPAFVPAAAELTFLGATLAGVVGAAVLLRLPRFYRSLDQAEGFERASSSGFFLYLRLDQVSGEDSAALADHEESLEDWLMRHGASRVSEVSST